VNHSTQQLCLDARSESSVDDSVVCFNGLAAGEFVSEPPVDRAIGDSSSQFY
jgi:hypothetical protein